MKTYLPILALLCAGIFAGCHSAPEKHYPVQGEVISMDAGSKLITLKHGDIPGFMPAMTMTYQVVEPKQIASLQPGDKISADLVVSENKARLEKIVRLSQGGGKTPPGTTQRVSPEINTSPEFAEEVLRIPRGHG
jgi:Cu/Ag efflux protein CusF